MPGHLRPIKVNSGYIEKYLCQKLGHKTFELNAVTYKLTRVPTWKQLLFSFFNRVASSSGVLASKQRDGSISGIGATKGKSLLFKVTPHSPPVQSIPIFIRVPNSFKNHQDYVSGSLGWFCLRMP